MNSNHCTITEMFSDVCGHLKTTVEHSDHCKDAYPYPCRISFSNNRDGQRFILADHRLEDTRWAGAQITESKCTVCEFVDQLQDTPEKLDLDCPKLNPTELATQREYWKNFVSDHAFLSQRQHNLSEAHQAAVQELDEENSGAENSERRNELLENVKRAKKAEDFYDLEQNYYFKIVRSMGFLEMTRLFDPTNLTSLTHELLYLVKPEDIPSGEICAICTSDLDFADLGPAAQSDNVRRVFCGSHLFHEKCIVVWFEDSQGRQVTCPMCRRTHDFYRAPPDEWHQSDQFNAEDFFGRVGQWNPDDPDSDGSDSDDSDRDWREPFRERVRVYERMQNEGYHHIARQTDLLYRDFFENRSIEAREGLDRIEQAVLHMFSDLNQRLSLHRQNLLTLIHGLGDSDGSDGSDGSVTSDGSDDSDSSSDSDSSDYSDSSNDSDSIERLFRRLWLR